MPKQILQKEAKVLREVAKNISLEEIKSSKIQKIIREMKEALDSQEDGVAIAAPQIGYSLRIFVVSKRVANITKKKIETEEDLEKENNDIVFINPVIRKKSKEKKWVEEGCLSIRYLYGRVNRSNKVTIEALDENGNKISRGGSGLLAQIFQHEVDHLDGILFIDMAKDIEDMPPEKINPKKMK